MNSFLAHMFQRRRGADVSSEASSLMVDRPAPSHDAHMSDVWTARFAFDIQYRELERTTSIGHGVLSAVTLVAALATPLLIFDVGTSLTPLVITFTFELVVYLTLLAVSVRHAMRVLINPSKGWPNIAREDWPAVRGYLNFWYMAQFRDAEEFADYFTNLDSRERRDYLIRQVYSDAKLNKRKAESAAAAIKWAFRSFGILAAMIATRFAIVVTS